MMLIKIFLVFLFVGLFSFGGGYSAVPIIFDAVNKIIDISSDEYANLISISECTPGPIMVNIATYIGALGSGIFGSIAATIACILPAFIIIIIFIKFYDKIINDKKISKAFDIISPQIMGIVMAFGVIMLYKSITAETYTLNIKSMLILLITLIIIFIYRIICKKSISSIKLIIIGAMVGIAINCVL